MAFTETRLKLVHRYEVADRGTKSPSAEIVISDVEKVMVQKEDESGNPLYLDFNGDETTEATDGTGEPHDPIMVQDTNDMGQARYESSGVQHVIKLTSELPDDREIMMDAQAQMLRSIVRAAATRLAEEAGLSQDFTDTEVDTVVGTLLHQDGVSVDGTLAQIGQFLWGQYRQGNLQLTVYDG